jgi:hypothetical protein
VRWVFCLLALVPAGLWAAEGTAADLAVRIHDAGLDDQECYRVREINFSKEDIRLYLTDGYLILGKPVNGRRISAVFTTDVEGGDGEILVMPPHRSERLSLATFTKSPNMNEHFKSVLMLFTDDTADLLAREIHSRARVRKSPEMGVLLADEWRDVLRNLSSSFEIRLVLDVLSGRPASEGFFYAAVAGKRLGNFDFVYDPRAREQIQLGQVAYRENRAFFDVWTSFQARSFRNGSRKEPERDFTMDNFRIEATLEPDLLLRGVTAATLTPKRSGLRVLYFDLSRKMRVTEVVVNGDPAEVFQRESLRANLLRGNDNDLFLVVAPQPLEAGRHYEIEFRHEGHVVSEAGNNIYYVGARGTWYPQSALQFARYDITFRYPKGLDLVFSGEIVEDHTEEEWRVTRRKTQSPIRLAGFNLGDYDKVKVSRSGHTVEVYANRAIEPALAPRSQQIIVVPQHTFPWPRNRRAPAEVLTIPSEPPMPDPAARSRQLADEIASAYEFMAAHFGPPPQRTLTVSPIPGTFGQGFPGLLYLSTLTYLDPKARPPQARDQYHQLFFSEILHAHETAHQWWGNIVTSKGYQDNWLMEALANYSALLMLEKKKGPRALQSVLDQYRTDLVTKNEDGRSVESAGPICWGARLNSSQARAWRVITYEKGSWIIHMLRRRLGDQRFLEMLGELCRRYRFQGVSMEDFRALAAEYMPRDLPDPKLENFFDNWVYSTGVPTLKLSYSLKGRAPKLTLTGTVSQSGVADDFSVYVPVRIQFRKGPPVTRWVQTDDESVNFTLSLRQAPQKVVLDPDESVLVAER